MNGINHYTLHNRKRGMPFHFDFVDRGKPLPLFLFSVLSVTGNFRSYSSLSQRATSKA